MSQDRTSCISMPFLVDASLPCSEKQLTEEDGSPAPQMFLPSSSLSSCFFLLSQPGPFLCSSWPLLLVLPAVDVENRWFPPLSTWKLLSCPICPTLPQSKQPKSLPFLFLECVFRSHFLDIFNLLYSTLYKWSMAFLKHSAWYGTWNSFTSRMIISCLCCLHISEWTFSFS